LISYVTSWSFARQWSSISLNQGPLRGNGHWFLMSHRGPQRGNGHWSLYIKTLYETMVIDFFVTLRPSTKQWSLIFFPFQIDPFLKIGLIYFFKKSEKKIIKQSDLSDRDPLHGNSHYLLDIDPLHGIGLICFFFKKTKRISVKSRPSTWYGQVCLQICLLLKLEQN